MTSHKKRLKATTPSFGRHSTSIETRSTLWRTSCRGPRQWKSLPLAAGVQNRRAAGVNRPSISAHVGWISTHIGRILLIQTRNAPDAVRSVAQPSILLVKRLSADSRLAISHGVSGVEALRLFPCFLVVDDIGPHLTVASGERFRRDRGLEVPFPDVESLVNENPI